MTLADLKHAAQLLPKGSSITLSVDDLLSALAQSPTPLAAAELPAEERLLTVAEVARRMSANRKLVYSLARGWPFARRIGGRMLRIESRGFEKWLSRQTARSGP